MGWAGQGKGRASWHGPDQLRVERLGHRFEPLDQRLRQRSACETIKKKPGAMRHPGDQRGGIPTSSDADRVALLTRDSDKLAAGGVPSSVGESVLFAKSL